mgnify:CR=1 FL=1
MCKAVGIIGLFKVTKFRHDTGLARSKKRLQPENTQTFCSPALDRSLFAARASAKRAARARGAGGGRRASRGEVRTFS